ncbi:MAG: ABC transporter ATP-binding protein [Planctomycetota bacterium]|jgi:oligopeptide/dipeptide ABC transporter ATP-binding protein
MMISDANEQLVVVRDLKTYFPVRGGLWRKRYVRAVDGVSFDIPAGRTLALVGESGSGKTTVGRTILRLVTATAGQVLFEGADVLSLPGGQMRELRRHMSMIFQDPAGSLNPRMTVGNIVAEPLKVHGTCRNRFERRARVAELLSRVGLSPDHAKRYRHEFSGGQRQRIGIARALATRPKFIVCDEPVSALDVSIQAQILNLLNDLQDELGLTYLFIAHNLAVVEHFADVVAVMYLGRIVEIADRDELYANPLHPYTHALFTAVPEPDPGRVKTHVRLEGETPSPITPPTGCPFHPRCPLARQAVRDLPADQTCPADVQGRSVELPRVCVQDRPELEPVPGRPGHEHACHLRR